ncbi:hypothetical protein [Parapedobacter tibetensis]|uniref:hypothetical protein n=1 Tax=Parapedobacter tibetensis TaxID=2972951 RepID=UPI00214D8240|nr:hypothetical protein [Parapedobacter tibetensis]
MFRSTHVPEITEKNGGIQVTIFKSLIFLMLALEDIHAHSKPIINFTLIDYGHNPLYIQTAGITDHASRIQ